MSPDLASTVSKGSELRYLRLGWLVLGLGVLAFLGWSWLAPLDRGVAVQGVLVADGSRKPVQHLSGGRVQEILVREGDTVATGQPVARLDTTAVQSELNASEANIVGLVEFIRATRLGREGKQKQARLLAAQIANIRPLADDGIVPRNRLVDLERQAAQVESALAQDDGSIAQATQQIAEMRERQVAWKHEIQSAVIRAPEAGIVQALTVFGPNTVVAAGQVILEIVPTDAPLRVEAQVPVHLIDRLQPGLEVDLMFTALNQSETPIARGQVLVVTPDRLVDQRTGVPFFRLNISLEAGAALNTRLRHGMPVDVFVKTGERSLASYLVKPLTDRLRSGMREN